MWCTFFFLQWKIYHWDNSVRLLAMPIHTGLRFIFPVECYFFLIRKKGRDLTQSYDKSPYTNRNVKRAKWQHKQRYKKVRLNSGSRTDLGRSVEVTKATQLVWLTGLRAHLPTNRNSRFIILFSYGLVSSVYLGATVWLWWGLGVLPQKQKSFSNFHTNWCHFMQYLLVHVLGYYATARRYVAHLKHI